jgi:thioredoxin 1
MFNLIVIITMLQDGSEPSMYGGKFVHFTASWCQPCQLMEPVVAELEKEGYVFQHYNVDTTKQSDLARYKVTSIPLFIFEFNGKELGRVVGKTSKQELVDLAATEKPPANIIEKYGVPKSVVEVDIMSNGITFTTTGVIVDKSGYGLTIWPRDMPIDKLKVVAQPKRDFKGPANVIKRLGSILIFKGPEAPFAAILEGRNVVSRPQVVGARKVEENDSPEFNLEFYLVQESAKSIGDNLLKVDKGIGNYSLGGPAFNNSVLSRFSGLIYCTNKSVFYVVDISTFKNDIDEVIQNDRIELTKGSRACLLGSIIDE